MSTMRRVKKKKKMMGEFESVCLIFLLSGYVRLFFSSPPKLAPFSTSAVFIYSLAEPTTVRAFSWHVHNDLDVGDRECACNFNGENAWQSHVKEAFVLLWYLMNSSAKT